MNLKKITLGLMLGVSSFTHGQQVIVDLSTGVYNGGSLAPIGYNTDDDTWKVKVPGSTVFNWAKVVNKNVGWAANAPFRWISPEVNGGSTPVASGNYEYRTEFQMPSCTNAIGNITLTKIGGDNTVTSIAINGTSYTLTAGFSPLASTTITSIPSSAFVTGTNFVTITVNNMVPSFTVTGLLVNGNLAITFEGTQLGPTISGPSTYCPYNVITYTGNASAATSNHSWSIKECTAAGAPIFSGYSWSGSTIAGLPSSFSFPIGLPFVCNKYYLVQLKVTNACGASSIASKTIQMLCPNNCYNPSIVIDNGLLESQSLDTKKETSFSIFPNPSKGIFSINLNKILSGAIEVYDAVGNLVKSTNVNAKETNYTIDMSAFPKGIYLINLKSGNEKYSEKIILD